MPRLRPLMPLLVFAVPALALPALAAKRKPAEVPAAAPAPSAGGPADYPMVRVPAGSFEMGSPADEAGRSDGEARRQVTLSRSFWMGTTEVSQGLWRSVMGSSPIPADSMNVPLVGDTLPMQNVSWCDGVAFANRLSAREGLPAAYQGADQCESSKGSSVVWDQSSAGYRLPTEAEWEYAARGGVGGPYAGGVSADGVCAVANVLNPSAMERLGMSPGVFFGVTVEAFACEDGHVGAAPVGSFAANAYGLHDMTGNVWEWCWDGYGAYGGASEDPTGAPTASNRVMRGGSWMNVPSHVRVANRGRNLPRSRAFDTGLRLVRTIP